MKAITLNLTDSQTETLIKSLGAQYILKDVNKKHIEVLCDQAEDIKKVSENVVEMLQETDYSEVKDIILQVEKYSDFKISDKEEIAKEMLDNLENDKIDFVG